VNGGAAQPLVVVTNWGAPGALLLGLLFLAVAAAAVVYWRLLAGPMRLSPAGLTALVAVGLALAWCVPVLFSSDVYAYAAYGEMARLGLNPYARVATGSDDALIRDAIVQWSGPSTSLRTGAFPICVYGPAFVLLAKVLVGALAPLGTLAQLQGMRAVASLALLACVPLAYSAFEGDRAARLRAAATIGLNPVVLWCAAEGHNDALALALVLAGFALVQRRYAAAGGAVVALSALMKLPGAAAAVALAVVDRRTRLGAAAGIAIAAVLSIPLFVGVATQLTPRGQYLPQASLQSVLAPLGPLPSLLLAAVLAAALTVRAVGLVRRARTEGWVYLGLAAWVLIPNPYPWYALWLVALAASAPRTRAASVALLLSFTSMLRYVPDAIAAPGAAAGVALGILATLPLFALLI
jgi:alpha-1,6-mannosyltransferase